MTLEFDNLWFVDFKLIPKDDTSLLLAKYEEEILKFFGQNDNNQKPFEKYMSKILKQDLPIENVQDSPKSFCMKFKDSFQAKSFNFVVTISEKSLNQVEFKLNIRKIDFQMFSDCHQDLMEYLKKEVLGKIFTENLI